MTFLPQAALLLATLRGCGGDAAKDGSCCAAGDGGDAATARSTTPLSSRLMEVLVCAICASQLLPSDPLVLTHPHSSLELVPVLLRILKAQPASRALL